MQPHSLVCSVCWTAQVFESLTDAQWVALSFVFLGMALICGMLLGRAVPWLALAGFLILLAGPQVLGR